MSAALVYLGFPGRAGLIAPPEGRRCEGRWIPMDRGDFLNTGFLNDFWEGIDNAFCIGGIGGLSISPGRKLNMYLCACVVT